MAKLKLRYPTLRHAPSVTCGAGSLRSLAQQADLSSTVFLTSGHTAVSEMLSAVLPRPVSRLVKPPGEPESGGIVLASEFLNRHQAVRLVIVGGGAVLDWGRLAWAHSQGLLDLESNRWQDASDDYHRPEIWLIPTTCATGAEAGDVAVYSAAEGKKLSISHADFLADRVILDGKFLQHIDNRILATFLCDALSHGIEGYLSLVPVNLAKESALSAIHMVTGNFSETPGSDARDRLMEAAFLGGVTATNCSVGIVHAFAHSIGADGMGHALANAYGLRAGIHFNAHSAQMKSLLSRLHMQHSDDLIERVQPILNAALTAVKPPELIMQLADPRYRSEIAERMAQDGTIRSNPRRPKPGELEEFLVEVHVKALDYARVNP